MNSISFNFFTAGFANQLMFIETILGISYCLKRPCIVYDTKPDRHHLQEKTINEYLNIPYPIFFIKEKNSKYEDNIDFHRHVFCTESTSGNLNFINGRKVLYPEYFNNKKHICSTGFGIYSSFFCGERSKEIKFILKSIKFNEEILNIKNKLLDKFKQFNAIHIRRGDFLKWSTVSFVHKITKEVIKNNIFNNFTNDIPIIIFTDDKNFFKELKEYITEYRLLFFDDIARFYTKSKDIISISSILVASHSEKFLGTFCSTFTALIHRYRVLNNKENNFLYITDGDMISSNNLPVGIPYSWNHTYYDKFASTYQIYWMREWMECI
jgi:hypothetical protein